MTPVERSAWLMGTRLTIRVEGVERERALGAMEVVFERVAEAEALLSTWDSATALGRLNRAQVGRSVPLRAPLRDVLLRAQRWAEETGRAFEPGVGPLVDAWGLRGEGRTPSEGELREARAAVRRGVRIDPSTGRALRRHPAAWIDSGAFGKGLALEWAGEALVRAGAPRALLDFGGQILTVGPPRGAPWRIAVAHPRRRNEIGAALRLGPGLSAATSGDSERPGHLLDPRTGRPVRGSWSVTVVSRDALAADALATGLHVMGPQEGLAWAGGRTDVGVLYLQPCASGLRARWNPAMERWLDVLPAASGRPDRTGSRDSCSHTRPTDERTNR